jgi:hypothetical protein
MKIKTITCHDVYNPGASLQAYALMKYLQELGHEVEIINYKPDYLSYNLWAIGAKWNKNIFLKILYYAYVIPKRLSLKKRRKKFDIFTKERLIITTEKYRSIDELKTDTPIADIYFAGSDQIWNTESPNGKDPSFFLDFVPEGAIKASYAASFSVSEIASEYIDFVKNRLVTFDFISVREKTGINILKSLGIEHGTVVTDPVFLLGKGQWEKLSKFQTDEKYIFVYDQENNPEIKKAALKLAKQYNLRIYAIESLYPRPYADRKIKDAGPEEFIGLIEQCEICLTNSFHCIAFSLIFNKKFYLFKRTHQKVNSRMLDLLDDLGLNNRIGTEDQDELGMNEINYQVVNDIIEQKRQKSINYINSVIEKAEING